MQPRAWLGVPLCRLQLIKPGLMPLEDPLMRKGNGPPETDDRDLDARDKDARLVCFLARLNYLQLLFGECTISVRRQSHCLPGKGGAFRERSVDGQPSFAAVLTQSLERRPTAWHIQ